VKYKLSTYPINASENTDFKNKSPCKRQVLFTLSIQLSCLSIAQKRNNERAMKIKMTWKEKDVFIENLTKLESKKRITSQNNFFWYNVPSMWATYASENNKIIFGYLYAN